MLTDSDLQLIELLRYNIEAIARMYNIPTA